ncbi:LLM class flavin-dependent oxidoreductase [Capillimicrobium parvum]|uniref:Flavin-dependent trigonelline monooxygenase, oxygenase component n=1 Tax=Capillimicrobium parvum TaxID=2884022 RepID=A0A9E6XWW8_9ACTN|nr:LLM class flavin-dependent oxidoreductase [Capillimicrobium parvum]UGS35957.1 Flavin-dependent trigonelline monooxygenase, oxygenase component [Capillimicrobium parvum]
MKFGLMFSQQVPPESGITWQQPYEDMLRCLPRAEELGYTSVFNVSHHVQLDGLCPSPLIALAGAAAVTEQMRIGPGVLLVPLYAPLKLAEDVAVLDCLSNGRLIFGVAPGYVSEEFAAHGVPREERFGRFWEALELMDRAWTEERFSFEGKYFQVPETQVNPKPVQQPVPIWWGLSGPKSLARAARRGGTLFPSPRHGIAEIQEHLDVWRGAGGEVDELPVIREVFVAETREKAEELAAPAVTYLFRELYGKKSAQGERELRDDAGKTVRAEDQVDFEHFKGRYVIGDPEFAYQELVKYQRELGATEIICWMHLPGLRGDVAMRSVELFAKEVMPAFREPASV